MTTLGSGSRRTCLQFGLAAGLGALLPAGAKASDTRRDPAVDAERFLQAQMEKLRIPGLSAVVVRNGSVVFAKCLGTASIEFDRPVEPASVFAINSVTKAFTGVAAMRLVEQGRLDLSAPIDRYLPDLPDAWRKLTPRQLLSHMSGLPDVMGAPTVETDAVAAWTWVKAQPIRFAPGDRFNYCQTNYTLMQQILNGLEGRALDAPLAEEQMRLVGMTETRYGDAYDVILRKGPTYRWVLPGPFVTGYSAAAPDAPRTLQATSERFLPFRRASSGLNSSARDMAKWLIALDSGLLMSAATRDLMWTPIASNNGKMGQWAMGWEVLARGAGRCIQMTGGGRAAVCFYPEARLGVVLLTNLTGAFPEDMTDRMASIFAPELDMAGVPGLRIALERDGYATIMAAARRLEAAHPGVDWPEAELNDWGYRLLSTGRRQDALPVFQFIADRYPQSGNAQDSLAQAYWVNGDTAAAVAHYRRALALDPGNPHAAAHIASLTQAQAAP